MTACFCCLFSLLFLLLQKPTHASPHAYRTTPANLLRVDYMPRTGLGRRSIDQPMVVVKLTDTDGDECEFRRIQCGSKWVVEQLVNGRREQLSVAVLSWNAKTRELTDGPGIRVVGKRGVLVHPEPLIL